MKKGTRMLYWIVLVLLLSACQASVSQSEFDKLTEQYAEQIELLEERIVSLETSIQDLEAHNNRIEIKPLVLEDDPRIYYFHPLADFGVSFESPLLDTKGYIDGNRLTINYVLEDGSEGMVLMYWKISRLQIREDPFDDLGQFSFDPNYDIYLDDDWAVVETVNIGDAHEEAHEGIGVIYQTRKLQ